MIHNRNEMDLTDWIQENPDYLEWAKIAADRDNLERAAVYAAIAQTQIAERQAAALERIANVLERADNLSKMFGGEA